MAIQVNVFIDEVYSYSVTWPEDDETILTAVSKTKLGLIQSGNWDPKKYSMTVEWPNLPDLSNEFCGQVIRFKD